MQFRLTFYTTVVVVRQDFDWRASEPRGPRSFRALLYREWLKCAVRLDRNENDEIVEKQKRRPIAIIGQSSHIRCALTAHGEYCKYI